MYPFALSRETYRTLGEYVLTKDDFLQAREIDSQDIVALTIEHGAAPV